MPIAFETSGVIGPKSRLFLKELGHLIKLSTGEVRSAASLLQRLSVVVQRGNAASVLGSISLSEDFNLIMFWYLLCFVYFVVIYIFIVFHNFLLLYIYIHYNLLINYIVFISSLFIYLSFCIVIIFLSFIVYSFIH